VGPYCQRTENRVEKLRSDPKTMTPEGELQISPTRIDIAKIFEQEKTTLILRRSKVRNQSNARWKSRRPAGITF
jgi:hypothetical protein